MKKIVEHLPLISALLIFIGYLDYITYYRFFDINIISYLTSGELLLSFLPLTWPILSLLLLVTLMFIFEIIPTNTRNEAQTQDESNEWILSIFTAGSSWKIVHEKWKQLRHFTIARLFSFLLHCMGLIWGVLAIVYFIIFIFLGLAFSVEKKLLPDWDRELIYLLSGLWFLQIFDIIRRSEKKGQLKHAVWINVYFIAIAFVYFMSLANKIKATDVLHGNPPFKVKFDFKGSTVKTDSVIVYIGQTSNYLFLRNIQSRSTLIYQMTEVNHLEISITTNKE